jgi:hypothetical protein
MIGMISAKNGLILAPVQTRYRGDAACCVTLRWRRATSGSWQSAVTNCAGAKGFCSPGQRPLGTASDLKREASA